ncbi:hypothetical protein C8R47DRAFT_311550 [Mycena vitilis]|nr:hypothetical protein C8R47DRAFT_311550 [Mycena vitilis]
MYHPYSGAAGYIYASEYPDSSTAAHHHDTDDKIQNFKPTRVASNTLSRNPVLTASQKPQSIDSQPYSPENTLIWTSESTFTQSVFSAEDEQYGRRARESEWPLIIHRIPVAHPYSQPWLDDESVVETSVTAKSQPIIAALPTLRTITIKEKEEEPVRRTAFVPYEPRPFEAERERERQRSRLAAAWRRKVRRRVKRALRRLRRYLEGF